MARSTTGLALALLATGCAGSHSVLVDPTNGHVERQARLELGCDEVSQTRGTDGSIEVEGCGRSATYVKRWHWGWGGAWYHPRPANLLLRPFSAPGTLGHYEWALDSPIYEPPLRVGPGDAGDGGRCRDAGDCGTGLGCHAERAGRVCRPICGGGAGLGCDGGRRCAGARGEVGFCVAVVEPPVDDSATHVAVEAAADGAACRDALDCPVGLGCHEERAGRVCRPLCGGGAGLGCDDQRRCVGPRGAIGFCTP